MATYLEEDKKKKKLVGEQKKEREVERKGERIDQVIWSKTHLIRSFPEVKERRKGNFPAWAGSCHRKQEDITFAEN